MDEVPRVLKWTDLNKILEWETLSSRNTYSYIQLITKQYFLFKSSPLLCECVWVPKYFLHAIECFFHYTEGSFFGIILLVFTSVASTFWALSESILTQTSVFKCFPCFHLDFP